MNDQTRYAFAAARRSGTCPASTTAPTCSPPSASVLDSRCRWKPSPSAPGATHLYHAAPDRLTLGNVQGARGGLGWLIDTRAAGEYVVGPGSFVDPSWPNQMEIFFSVVQRKVVTPNDSTSLDQVEYGPIAFERRSTRPPDPSDGSSLRPTSRT